MLTVALGLMLVMTRSSAEAPWRAPARANAQRNPLLRSQAAQGARLFASHCAPCHGPAGRGDGLAAAALNPRPRNLTGPEVQRQTDGSLFWKISQGRGAMPAWSWLQAWERWALVWVLRDLARAAHEETQPGQ